MSKARELADLGSVTTRLEEVGNTDGALSNRNMLINGDFSVWQRSTAHNTVGYGSVDRWSQHFLGAQTISRFGMNQTRANEIKAACGHVPQYFVSYVVGTLNTYSGFRTRIEDIMQVSGQTLTLSIVAASEYGAVVRPQFRVWNTSSGASQDISIPTLSGVTTDSVMRRYTWTFNVADVFTVGATPDGSAFFEVEIYTDRTGWHDYACFQLEVGDTATPFEHRPYGQELALCQRYYWKPAHGQMAGAATNGTILLANYPFPVSMRTQPTTSGTSETMLYNRPFVSGGNTGQFYAVESLSNEGCVVNYNNLSQTLGGNENASINRSDVQFDAEL